MSDDEFLAAFEALALPRALWTHTAHLRMAFLYLSREPNIAAALPLIRQRIQAYNCTQGNPNGYHETITAAFVHLIASTIRETPAEDFAEFAKHRADLLASDILLHFYTRECLYSAEARAGFVEPDRAPLP